MNKKKLLKKITFVMVAMLILLIEVTLIVTLKDFLQSWNSTLAIKASLEQVNSGAYKYTFLENIFSMFYRFYWLVEVTVSVFIGLLIANALRKIFKIESLKSKEK